MSNFPIKQFYIEAVNHKSLILRNNINHDLNYFKRLKIKKSHEYYHLLTFDVEWDVDFLNGKSPYSKGFTTLARKALNILYEADREYNFHVRSVQRIFRNELLELQWADNNQRKYPLSKADKVEYILQKPNEG